MSLQDNYQEADTRLLLHSKASCDEGNDSIVLLCEDINVFILALSTLQDGVQKVYQKRGEGRTCAFQWIKNIRFSENLTSFAFLKHPFWDSPFCLITNELKASKKVQEKDIYLKTFSLLGLDVSVSSNFFFIFPKIQLPENRFWYCSSEKNLPDNGILSWWLAWLLHCMKLEKNLLFSKLH